MKPVKRYDCDGAGPHADGETRRLPMGGGAGVHLCRSCLAREIAWREARNRDLSDDAAYDLPAWDDLTPLEG